MAVAAGINGISFVDISGIAKEWDSYEDVRNRLRCGEDAKEGETGDSKKVQILANQCCQDISTCVKNTSFLEPLLTRMAVVTKRPVPGIDQLKEEIMSLLKINKRGTDFEWDEVAKAGWCLRKLCGFVKMKCRRREVSNVTRLRCQQVITTQIISISLLLASVSHFNASCSCFKLVDMSSLVGNLGSTH